MADLSDEQINRLYQKLPQFQPSEMTDARILRAARNKAKKPVRVSSFFVGHRWQWLSSAAVLLLVVSVVFRVTEQAKLEQANVESMLPRAQKLMEAPPTQASSFADSESIPVPVPEKEVKKSLRFREKPQSLALAMPEPASEGIEELGAAARSESNLNLLMDEASASSMVDVCIQQHVADIETFVESEPLNALRQMEKEGKVDNLLWNEDVKKQTATLRELGQPELADCLYSSFIKFRQSGT